MNLTALSNEALLEAMRALILRSTEPEADLIEHIGEVDARKLYLDRAFTSMHVYCRDGLGFSDDAADTRIKIARKARELPAILDCVRRRSIHISGLRALCPHLNEDNHLDVLQKAEGKTKAQIEVLIACLAPKPVQPDSIRKMPEPTLRQAQGEPEGAQPVPERVDPPALAPAPVRPATVQPHAVEVFKVSLYGSTALKQKLEEAAALMSHRVKRGDLATVVEEALDLLIAKVKKDRFGIGAKPRSEKKPQKKGSRHVPVAMQRDVYEEGDGQCTYVDPETGRRCEERALLQIDHLDGFARTQEHDPRRLALKCRSHNLHAARQMYGNEFMASKMIRSGTDAGAGGAP